MDNTKDVGKQLGVSVPDFQINIQELAGNLGRNGPAPSITGDVPGPKSDYLMRLQDHMYCLGPCCFPKE